jgi:peptidoglycan/LPS O-acetylase OafA/YrhL
MLVDFAAACSELCESTRYGNERVFVVQTKIIRFQCITHGWTISLDFQLTLVTPLLVLIVCKWKKSRFVIFPSLIAITQYLIMKQTEIEGVPRDNL